jgi:UDP-N-acetylmuramoylalanine--D-glutamate ligase
LKAHESLAGANVTVMGLGLHGGGASAARFLAREGARVTVTDLRGEAELGPSLEALGSVPIRFVLGRHEEEDFSAADIVIKNPAVRRSSPYLAHARHIETDISIFLARNPAAVVAITGTKGKSSTSSATHHVLARTTGHAFLGGNITRSPLEFLDRLTTDDTVVLELSSFQLGDLTLTPGGISALRPRVSVITSIFRDHLNYYGSMEEYVADKRQVYRGQGPRDWTLARDDEWGRSFLAETPAQRAVLSDERLPPATTGAYLDGELGYARVDGEAELIVPAGLLVPGGHMRRNLLAAGLIGRLLGVDATGVREAVSTFSGIGHRLELVDERNGVRFYNDSAATIPEATLEAVSSFAAPVHLIAGGTDKNIDFGLFADIAAQVRALYLLDGNATAAISRAAGAGSRGPYGSLEEAVAAAAAAAREGEIVILSPGCASFGMFQNEFDRGRRFRDIVKELR